MINATQRRVKRQVFSLMFDLPELRLPNKKSVEAMGSGLHRCLPQCPPVVFWMSFVWRPWLRPSSMHNQRLGKPSSFRSVAAFPPKVLIIM
jgi:hypothetical protein